jgi:hypothetical protein
VLEAIKWRRKLMSGVIGQPQVGQWYQRRDNSELFQVTGIDEHARTVEIQAFDGSIDEVDLETWRVLPLELAEAAEDGVDFGGVTEADDLAFMQAKQTLDDPARLARLP